MGESVPFYADYAAEGETARPGERSHPVRTGHLPQTGPMLFAEVLFKNFKLWRGRLPHWRADDVRYFVTFRHRRPLNDEERTRLMRALLRPDGAKWDLMILCVLPDQTDLIFSVREDPRGRPYELSGIVEKAKAKVGRDIMRKSAERSAPFYGESFDRIIRDEIELEERWQAILDSPVHHELVEDAENWPTLWVANSP